MSLLGEPTGQGWLQIGELGFAMVLSASIGLERELRQKSAGLRTHTLVGFASALFMLVSKYGFTDVLGAHTVLDPSRVAAQIVSGIGFIGGGLIFVRRDAVRGLTTAAVVWLTAAVGMAAGAGLPVLALIVTAGHFLVVFGFAPLAAKIPRSTRAPIRLRLDYRPRRGTLRAVLARCTELGFTVEQLVNGPIALEAGAAGAEVEASDGTVSVRMVVQGRTSLGDLVAALAEIDGVSAVGTTAEIEE